MAIIQEHGQGTHIVLVSSRSGKWTVPFPSYHKFLLSLEINLKWKGGKIPNHYLAK